MLVVLPLKQATTLKDWFKSLLMMIPSAGCYLGERSQVCIFHQEPVFGGLLRCLFRIHTGLHVRSNLATCHRKATNVGKASESPSLHRWCGGCAASPETSLLSEASLKPIRPSLKSESGVAAEARLCRLRSVTGRSFAPRPSAGGGQAATSSFARRPARRPRRRMSC